MIQKIYNFMKSIRMFYEKMINKIMFAYFGVKIEGQPGKIEGIVTVRSQHKGTITIGKGIQLRAGKKYNMIGGDTRLILRTYRGGSIRIGQNVGISNSALVSMNHIEIEDNVMIGGSCKIWDTDFHSLNSNERMDEYFQTEWYAAKASGCFQGREAWLDLQDGVRRRAAPVL